MDLCGCNHCGRIDPKHCDFLITHDFGYDYKALKDGQKVAVNTGIREIPNTLICYTICGALMGTVGIFKCGKKYDN